MNSLLNVTNPSLQREPLSISRLPGKGRLIWELFKLGLSRDDVRNLHIAGEMAKLRNLALGIYFIGTRKTVNGGYPTFAIEG